MKKIFWFVVLLLFSQKAMSQNIVSIKLTEATRGVYKEIFITEKACVINNNSEIRKKSINAQTWQNLQLICTKINVENLSKYQSSTRKRANDVALQATLELTTEAKTFQSNIFDHDNPPKELSDLIKELKKL